MRDVLAYLRPHHDVAMASEKFSAPVRFFLLSGIEPIDDATGGFPFGRGTEIYGPEGCGKTALAWLLCHQSANRHEIYERLKDGSYKKFTDPHAVVSLFGDVEGSQDDNQIALVKGEKVDAITVPIDTVEEFFNLIEKTMKKCKEVEEKSGHPVFLVIVVDTAAGLATQAELKADWKKEDYPRQAKYFRRGFRRVKSLINGKNVALIINNQVGDNFKSGSTPGRTVFPDDGLLPPIGKAIKYWSRLRIFVWQVSANYKFVKGARSPAGLLLGFFVKKNNQGPKPGQTGRYALLFEGNENLEAGLNNLHSKLEHMVFMGVAERDKDGRVDFKFKKFGITPTTFGAKVTTLEDEGDNDAKKDKAEAKPGRARNPSILNRAEWFEFYTAHKADLDLLYGKAVELMRRTEGIDLAALEAEEAEDESESDDINPLDDSSDTE